MSYLIKLGPHVQTWSRRPSGEMAGRWTSLLDYILIMRPPILKTLEPNVEALSRYKAEVGGIVIAREYLPEGEQDYRSTEAAQRFYERAMANWRPCLGGQVGRRGGLPLLLVDYFELYNETGQTGEDISRLADFSVECCKLFHREGVKVAVGSFSVGNPPDLQQDWARFRPAVEAGDAIALHEYGAPYSGVHKH